MMSFWLAQLVVAQRLPHLADEAARFATGKSGGVKRLESERMVSEKIAATQAGILASSLESWRSAVAIGTAAATGNLPHAASLMLGAPDRVNRAALAPANAAMRANMRRLSRKK